jgi:hypothetical protein
VKLILLKHCSQRKMTSLPHTVDIMQKLHTYNFHVITRWLILKVILSFDT